MLFVTAFCVIVIEVWIMDVTADYENTFCLQRRCPYDGYFRCKVTGRCISPSQVCNGYDNCRDGSDEEMCGGNECSDGYGFYCDGGARCLSFSAVCSGYTSCLDGADEENCLSKPCPYDGDFKCNDTGVCLRSTDVCDGYSECQNRYRSDSDYDEHNCVSKPCPYDGDFKCNDTGVCIRSTDVCDGYSECQSRYRSDSDYDEQNCDTRPCPYNGDHRCGDNKCIKLKYVCDGSRQCRDGSDEFNCSSVDCPYDGDFRCHSDGVCIRSYQVCNGLSHCRDQSDEENCSSLVCPYDSDFRCHSDGVCIRSYQVCDGLSHCRDQSDEENCTSLNCRAGLKYCNRTDSCYPFYWICYYDFDCGYDNESSLCYNCGNSTRLNYNRFDCDGIQDCADGSDELNCYERECFAADDFRCTTTGACIRNVQVCDGAIHCSDESDEINCLFRECPIPGDVKCQDNGVCIHSDIVCDGVSDCMDGSDEVNCSMKTCPYSDDLRCSTSQVCIRAEYMCNGYINCEDGSDEKDCYNNRTCPYDGDFQCVDNGMCIRARFVCDGYERCLDGSDEGMNYCPEEVTMGVVWERSLTKTTHKHQCSSIHPSFKLADTITRECMKNRRWGPVDLSQCVMDVDSPVVMILTVGLSNASASVVQLERDQIITEVREKVIQQAAVHVDIVHTTVNVSLRITYEFNTLTADELAELVNFEMNLETLGNFSVSILPELIIFESTSMCHCPKRVNDVTLSVGNINSMIYSVCSGKPCDCRSDLSCQCIAPFIGNGVVCGRDSDGDGYADMKLNCDDPECEQDTCATIYNPDQATNSCAITQGCTDSDEGRSTSITAIGITFILTMIVSVALTLLIVCIVHMKKSSTKGAAVMKGKDEEEKSVLKNPNVLRPSKRALSRNFSAVYEIPEGEGEGRYQSHPGGTIQRNPAYRTDYCNTLKDSPEYENTQVYDDIN